MYFRMPKVSALWRPPALLRETPLSCYVHRSARSVAGRGWREILFSLAGVLARSLLSCVLAREVFYLATLRDFSDQKPIELSARRQSRVIAPRTDAERTHCRPSPNRFRKRNMIEYPRNDAGTESVAGTERIHLR